MILKLNMPIYYLNFSLPKFQLKSKLKQVRRKLKNIITQNCVKGLVDEEENNMKLDMYYLYAKFQIDRWLRVEPAPFAGTDDDRNLEFQHEIQYFRVYQSHSTGSNDLAARFVVVLCLLAEKMRREKIHITIEPQLDR